MAQCRKPNIFPFSASPVDAVNFGGREDVSASRFRRRNAGFTAIEVLLVIAIVAIMGGFSVIGIKSILDGIRANGAMYQVIASLREARTLAMTQDRRVSVTFTSDDSVMMQIRDNDGSFVSVGNFFDERSMIAVDPSIAAIDYGYKFMRNDSIIDTPDSVGGLYGGIVLDGEIVTPTGTSSAADAFVFTADGFFTRASDLDQPINGTIFIGRPNGEDKLTRAVTIWGASGRISAWQWGGSWRPVVRR